MNAIDTSAINSQGVHHRELRRKSEKVLLGATKVLKIRCASESGGSAGWGAAAGTELMNNAPSGVQTLDFSRRKGRRAMSSITLKSFRENSWAVRTPNYSRVECLADSPVLGAASAISGVACSRLRV